MWPLSIERSGVYPSIVAPLKALMRLVQSPATRRLFIAVVAFLPLLEQAMPDACDADGRALQVQVASADVPDGGANELPDHPMHVCHCSHAHAQMVTGSGVRIEPAELRRRGFPRCAFELGRLPDAPPARPPALA
jgi:hypothetical protein